MFLPLSYTEFIDMMKRGVKTVFDSKDSETTQSQGPINNIQNQIEIADDQTQNHSKGN